jgi:hypothetical protein
MMPDSGTYRHPQPRSARIPVGAAAFALSGGPVAWFIQLCANFWMASWSCFPTDHRGIKPIAGIDWSWPSMLALWAASMLIAVLALLTSWRLFKETREGRDRDYYHLIEDGDGRLAFLAFWGVLFSGGALLTLIFNVVAFVVLPRCAG